MRLYDVITDCIQLKLSGAATDNVIQCFGGNILTKKASFGNGSFEQRNIALDDARSNECTCLYQRRYFSCKCIVCTNCPLSSSQNLFYEIKRPFWFGHIGVYLVQHGIKLTPVDDASFSKLIDDTGYVQRYKSWCEKES